MSRTTSYDVLSAKISETAFSVGARKNWKSEVDIRRFLSVYFGYMGGQNPLGGLSQKLFGRRYPRRNHVFQIWWWSVQGLASAEGQILPFSIDFDGRPYNTLTLPCERVMKWYAQDKVNQLGEWTEWGWRNEGSSFHRWGERPYSCIHAWSWRDNVAVLNLLHLISHHRVARQCVTLL